MAQLMHRTNVSSNSTDDGREALVAWLARELDYQGCSADTVGAHSRYVIQIIENDDVEEEMFDDKLRGAEFGSVEPHTAAKRRARRRKRHFDGVGENLVAVNGRLQHLLPSEALCRGLDKIKVAKAAQWVQSISSDPYEVDVLIDEVRFRLQQLRSKVVRPQSDAQLASEASTLPARFQQSSSPVKDGSEDSVISRSPEVGNYFCEFPALATKESLVQIEPVADVSWPLAVVVESSAWCSGPPQQRVKNALLDESEGEDEGVGEELSEPLDLESLEDEDPDDECRSISSEGSDLLQLVTKILHHFNSEIEAAAEDAGLVSPATDAAVTSAATHPGAQEFAWLWEEDAQKDGDHGFLLDEFHQDLLNSTNTLTDYGDDVDSPMSMLQLASSVGVWADAAGLGNMCAKAYMDSESEVDYSAEIADINAGLWSDKQSLSKSFDSSASPVSLQKSFSDADSGASIESPKPRLRQSPPFKNRRACSFFLRGHCKKEDCEFAHDLSLVTCKFWEFGECFKGATCPFLHGYPDDE